MTSSRLTLSMTLVSLLFIPQARGRATSPFQPAAPGLTVPASGQDASTQAGAAAVATSAPDRTADVLPFRATQKTLANGLQVVIVPTGFPNIVSLHVPVQTGSRNEVEPGKSGFAHFFEHLMFRGTPTNPPDRYRDIMVRAGARENASTGDDFTRYYATFAKEDLDTMLALYADMFQHLAYSEADFKTEAGAILGEYNKNVSDPLQKLFEVQRDQAFTTHTYKHTTMGFLKDIQDMPNQYEYSKVFFSRWYRPEYATLIVAGDVDAGRVLPLVEKYWGGWKPAGAAQPVTIPREPAPQSPKYVHVPWSSPTLPIVTVAFPAPAFSDVQKDYAAMEMIASLFFGPTSDLYKKLVIDEQKVDMLAADNPGNVDPALFTVIARVKNPADAAYVRDEMMRTAQRARVEIIPSGRLDDAKSNARYAFTRTLDSTDRIAAVVASYAPYARSYDTVNRLYRVFASLGPEDLQRAAQQYFVDAGLVVTTLSREPLPAPVSQLRPLSSYASADPAPDRGAGGGRPDRTARSAQSAAPAPAQAGPGEATRRAGAQQTGEAADVLVQRSVLPQLSLALLFATGSADDRPGKEGLAALSAAMIADAGSRALGIDRIEEALYPIAASFSAQVDKEMTTFRGSVHRDNWRRFFDVSLPQLIDPGFREEDFARLKARQRNALVQNLRSDNEEELGKERLQANIFRGTPYGHPALGTVAGIDAVTLDDVKAFVRAHYTRANLRAGVNGDVPAPMLDRLREAIGTLPPGTPPATRTIQGRRPSGIEVELIEKDTRSTAISLGLPIAVTRAHPDFAALSVARAWLGEHRASSGRLFQRLREVRGLNYGDYAYIEAFPRGMFQFFPDPNLGRRAQIFEVWIRPVEPVNAHMALRIAIAELDRLVTNGLSEEDFRSTRDYLAKNVYLMTQRQAQQLGYALDAAWYGTGEFTSTMREQLGRLTRDAVNAAVRRHFSASDLSVVMITRDAAALRDQLVSDAPSSITYEGQKPAALLDEDKVIGARKLGIAREHVTITPVADVFAR